MDFVNFCRSHGLQLDYLPPAGRWVRVKTDDHPHKRNGAVLWMGDYGLCQNWATMESPVSWRGEATSDVIARCNKRAEKSRRIRERAQQEAARKAAAMLAECHLSQHPYLTAKGFPDAQMNVLPDGRALVPMYVGRHLVGCQTITADGEKKFLYGQRCAGAEFVMGSGDRHFFCEGYATGLSLQAALSAAKISYSIHVTFSAGNLKRIAQALNAGFVVADNDASGTGQRVAKESGLPYWISDKEGEDFNDAHQRLGTFQMAMQLKRLAR